MKKWFYILLLMFLFGCVKQGIVQYSETNTVFSKKMKILKLKNGLDVIMVRSTSQPIVTIEIVAKNGAYTQTQDNCGLSHLYEHMFFKGNKKWQSQEEYQKRVRELGIIYNGMTSNETVRYYFTLPSENIKQGLEFMSYAIREPLFDSIELEKEKNVVLNEFRRDFSQPDYIFYQESEKAMFEKYFYRKNAIGEENIIKNATRQQMIEIKNKFYIPNNCALIIVGDMDFDKTQKYVEQYFSSWQRGEELNFNFPPHPMLETTKKIYVVSDIKMAKLRIEYRAGDVDDNREETYSFDVLSELLSMKTFPLRKKLIDSGLAYEFYGGYYTQQDGATFSFYIILDESKIDTVISIIDNEIALMTKQNYFNNKMISESINKKEINILYSIESSRGMALDLGFWWAITDIDYLLNYIPNLKKVDSEDLSNIINKYIYNKNRVISLLVNREYADKHLDKSWKECGK